jgi:hypothetical protein
VRGAAGEEATRRFLDGERGYLGDVFPDGRVEDRQVTDLGVAIR